jgi:hypothetical protein
MAPGDHEFSTLEAVDPDDEHLREQKSLSPLDLGKQVVPEEGKEVFSYDNGLEATPDQHFPSAQKSPLKPPFQKKRRTWTLVGSVVLLVVILAATVGGVLGSRKGTANSISTSTPSSDNTVLQRQHAIAAVSFSSDNGINNTRVYFQDEEGDLLEAASSSSNTTWQVTPLGFTGMNRSSLAAAVSRPGFDLVSAFPLQQAISDTK